MAFNIPEGVNTSALDESMNVDGGAVNLPFLAAYFYVINGDSRLRAIGGAQYFGGWQVDADDCLAAALEFGETDPPSYFKRDEVIARNNKSLAVFQTRAMLVAPIGVRKSWYQADPASGSIRRSVDYFPGARQHVQALVYIASKTADGAITPWGPGVLSAKGWQAGNLIEAFSGWKSHIDKVRRQVAQQVPAWCFYLSVGTFGDTRIDKAVGKNATSTITPIGAYLPQTVDQALLEKLYVGPEVFSDMVRLAEESSEWLNAWGQLAERAQAAPPPPVDDFPLDPILNYDGDDDIPF